MTRNRGGRPRTTAGVVVAIAVVIGALAAAGSAVAAPPPGGAASVVKPSKVVEVTVKNRRQLDRLIGTGVDLTEHVRTRRGRIVTQAVVTSSCFIGAMKAPQEVGPDRLASTVSEPSTSATATARFKATTEVGEGEEPVVT